MLKNMLSFVVCLAVGAVVMAGLFVAVKAITQQLSGRSEYERYERFWVEGN